MSKMPIVQALKDYINKNNSPFSMPGGKGGRGFDDSFKEILLKGDITEVEGLDNLHKAEGIIKEAEELLRDYYGSTKSFFLVNGSTSGNITMIFSALKEGDKVLVERGCHKSIFNGILLRKLIPVYISNAYSKENHIPLGIDYYSLINLLEEHKDIKAIILTYPNYYGVCGDLKSIIKECKKRDIKVLVDAAHGAHFGAHKALPENPVKLGADMVVMSAHKTLPSLTQGAYLHVNHKELLQEVERYLYMFLSTSPSYLIMASLDYGRGFMEEQGEEAYEELLRLLSHYKELINTLPMFKCLDRQQLLKNKSEKIYDFDDTRLVIQVRDDDGSGYRLLDYLGEKGLQGEMADDKNVVLITNPFNVEEDFKSLYMALKECGKKDILDKELVIALEHSIPKLKLPPYEALKKERKLCSIEESLNSICAENIIPYPPGIPLVMMGEVMDKQVIDKINFYINNKVTILGVRENNIWVLK